MNRTKALVLCLFAIWFVIVAVILPAARDVADHAVGQRGNQRSAEIAELLALAALFALLSTGVIRSGAGASG